MKFFFGFPFRAPLSDFWSIPRHPRGHLRRIMYSPHTVAGQLKIRGVLTFFSTSHHRDARTMHGKVARTPLHGFRAVWTIGLPPFGRRCAEGAFLRVLRRRGVFGDSVRKGQVMEFLHPPSMRVVAWSTPGGWGEGVPAAVGRRVTSGGGWPLLGLGGRARAWAGGHARPRWPPWLGSGAARRASNPHRILIFTGFSSVWP